MTVEYKLLRPTDQSGKLKSEPVSIQIIVCNKNTRVRLTTGLKIIPKFWGNGGAKASLIDSSFINNELTRYKSQIAEAWKLNKNISGATLKGLVCGIVQGDNQPDQKKTVEPWIEQFIQNSKKKSSTKQVYKSTLDHLKAYAAEFSVALTWESFDLNFYQDFTEFLYSIGHCDNTVGKVIKTIKTFLSEAFERDLHTNLSFKKKAFKVIRADVDEIFLSADEITQFHNADISSRPDLIKSKKMFVFGCWVGLRFSDLSKLNPNHALNTLAGPVLKITTQKTGEDVTIPFHPIAQEIWDSWGGYPPKQNNPAFNQDIKDIAKLAGLDQPVQKRNTIKGVVTIEWVPKYTMVKAHTCRRSFATNCELMGVPTKTTMAVTGHKTEKAFKKYVKITKDQHASIMAGYFNQGIVVMKKAQ